MKISLKKAMNCRAELLTWEELDKRNYDSSEFFWYLGNYRDDEHLCLYALFANSNERYCVKIS